MLLLIVWNQIPILGLKVEFLILIKMKNSRLFLLIRVNYTYNSKTLAKQLGISICPITSTANHPKTVSFLLIMIMTATTKILIFQFMYSLSTVIQEHIWISASIICLNLLYQS